MILNDLTLNDGKLHKNCMSAYDPEMESPMPRRVTTISVSIRHSPDCPKNADSTWRRCRRRKYLYIYEGGRAKQEKNTTVDDAVDRGIATLKYKTPQTLATYARTGRRVKNWTVDLKIGNLVDVTAAKLGEWQGKWGKDATEKHNRMGQASQNQFQDYLSRFCLWATNMEYARMDPSWRAIPA